MLLGAVAALAWHRRRRTGTAAVAPVLRAWLGAAAVGVVLVSVGNVPLKSLAGPALMAVDQHPGGCRRVAARRRAVLAARRGACAAVRAALPDA
jgi:hypothetical protein